MQISVRTENVKFIPLRFRIVRYGIGIEIDIMRFIDRIHILVKALAKALDPESMTVTFVDGPKENGDIEDRKSVV